MINLLKSYYLWSIKVENRKKLKIAIGTDAFPPTTDGISNVAQSYADIINKKFGEAVVVTPKNPNQLDYRYDYQIYRYKSWWVPTKEGYSIGLSLIHI